MTWHGRSTSGFNQTSGFILQPQQIVLKSTTFGHMQIDMPWTHNLKVHLLHGIKIWQPKQVILKFHHIQTCRLTCHGPSTSGFNQASGWSSWLDKDLPATTNDPEYGGNPTNDPKFYHIQTCKSTWQHPQLQGLIKLQDFIFLIGQEFASHNKWSWNSTKFRHANQLQV